MQLVSMENISKSFNGLWANHEVSISLERGEIVSLLGENGAGKTTLMNILYGLYRPNQGDIFIKGEKRHLSSPKVAIDLGISMVHQHFMLVDSLTVMENIIIGNEPQKRSLIDTVTAQAKVESLAQTYGLAVDGRARVGTLSVGEKQRIELLKALYNECDVLILDEPTAVLTPEEVDIFFVTLQKLRAAGKGVILISHKLRETMAIADRIYIMRSGKIVAETTPAETSVEILAELMVGRAVDSTIERSVVTAPQTLLKLDNVVALEGKQPVIDQVTLELKAGQILGIAGVDGNGQSELVELLTGLRKISSGTLQLHEDDISHWPVKERYQRGLGVVPEDRSKSGLVAPFSVMENLILGYQNDARFTKKSWINWKKVNQYAKRVIKAYDVRCKNELQRASALSGGNQQKLIIGRVLEANPEVIIAAQPTRGVDIGAIEYIHKRLVEMRNLGKAVLLVSADLDEIIKLSDEIAVMYEGKIVSLAPNGTYNKGQLGTFMAGMQMEGINHGA